MAQKTDAERIAELEKENAKLRSMMDHSLGALGFVVYGSRDSIDTLARRLAPYIHNEVPLFDRIEFALRDAGFNYDDAFRLAYRANAMEKSAPLWTLIANVVDNLNDTPVNAKWAEETASALERYL